MKERLNRRLPSAAIVISLLAFGIAIGGGAYAAGVKLKAGSVKTKTIKNNAVKTAKIANNAVTEAKIKDGSVTSKKLGACKAGTVLIRGECWETTPRAALTWFAASDACGAAGGRLPLSSELMAVRNEPGFDLGSNGGGTSNMGAEQFGNQYGAVDDNGAVSVVLTANATARPFRCVLPRS